MKTITVTLVARDAQDVLNINGDLAESQILNNYPCFSWSTDDATEEVKTWMATEYEDQFDE